MLSTIKLLSLSMICSMAVTVNAQSHLDQYIAEGLKKNSGVRQQYFQLDKAMYALKEARSYFLPNISLRGDYVRAKGGRTIDIPIGDLLNPAYNTLNQLTESNKFPQLENASIQLNPDNFYDTRFRTSLSLINAEIWYNKEIKKQMIDQQRAALNVYKRELVKDIKLGYYHYYQAVQAVKIYEHALTLVAENVRVNESLVRNGVRNSTSLTRSKSEQEKIKASLAEAENTRNNAQSYLNFLLNEPLDRPIALDDLSLDSRGLEPVTGQREELGQLQVAQSMLANSKKLQQSYLIPKLNTFLDLGSQGFDWQFNDKSRYFFWGLNLHWDLFAGGQRTYRAKQATLDMQSNETRIDETARAIELQVSQAENSHRTALANYQSAQSQLAFAGKYYNDQLKVYKEGQLLYIELLDAQNQLTSAALQRSVAFVNVLVASAELERSKAAYPITQNK